MNNSCCNQIHPFDQFDVAEKWIPQKVKCLIMGENPGDTSSSYFYEISNDYMNDKIRVRRSLLSGLLSQKLIIEQNLEAFKRAGFLFDHAIRCHLPSSIVTKQRNLAVSYKSDLVNKPDHLIPYIEEAEIVWIMGHIANNAVCNLVPRLLKEPRQVSKSPFPGPILVDDKFFLSSYFTRWNVNDIEDICEAFHQFSVDKGVKFCV